MRKKAVPNHPPEEISPPQPETGDITLIRHQARCTICRHPERDAIEQAFLHWTRPSVIAYEFNLGSRLAVYRHAHALGLFQRRNLQTQHALGYLVEQAQSVKPTADSIIRAVKALSCFDDAGRYHEPRKEVLITHQVVNLTAPPEPATTGPRVYPEGAKSARKACPEAGAAGRSVPAHSYSIAPVGTGDSPIHLKLDSLEAGKVQSFTQSQPEVVEGFTRSQPNPAGEPLH